MKIIMDACTVILLAKASVFESLLEAHKVSITNQVFEEIMKGKSKMAADALLLERLHSKKKIGIISADPILMEKIRIDFNMGAGESSIIAIGLKGNCIVATDNRQGRKAALINNLPLVGSIELIVSLYKTKKIDQSKAKASLKILQEEGWFDNYLIEKAMEDIQ